MTDARSRRIYFHPDLLARIETAAAADRRTLANWVASTIERALDYWELNKMAPPPDGVKVQAIRREAKAAVSDATVGKAAVEGYLKVSEID